MIHLIFLYLCISDRYFEMNILTFDIEDWYHIIHKYPNDILKKWNSYEDRVHIGTEKILEVLLENNIKATFFVLGYIDGKTP